jgi:hypothetical protein
MSRIMPALTDGRCFTSYLASCQYDQHLQAKFGQASEPSFRQYLQANAMAAQQETRKLHVCAFAFDSLKPGPPVSVAAYSPAPTSLFE